MRRRDIRLRMNTYTHLCIAETASAPAALPAFQGHRSQSYLPS